ncbi:MAG: DUF1573 domain-containing protein [Candidatus Omnitrophica bacterium]|nr:DUF1573 domain-containing protein [Candidatus Omnitrophota bacterium]MDD5079565.1 DUF1573 domain-containing protein [Candidatus Omnitrophota bacterium]
MKALFGLCFFLSVLAGCYAQAEPLDEADGQAAQVQSADPYLWDFGAVKAGKPVEHEFIFTNKSEKPFNITGSYTSCGCTVSKIARKSLAPGESTAIDVEFKTTGYNGDVHQFIYVNTDDPANPAYKFTIKARVIK